MPYFFVCFFSVDWKEEHPWAQFDHIMGKVERFQCQWTNTYSWKVLCRVNSSNMDYFWVFYYSYQLHIRTRCYRSVVAWFRCVRSLCGSFFKKMSLKIFDLCISLQGPNYTDKSSCLKSLLLTSHFTHCGSLPSSCQCLLFLSSTFTACFSSHYSLSHSTLTSE